jgi:hypothetical protein
MGKRNRPYSHFKPKEVAPLKTAIDLHHVEDIIAEEISCGLSRKDIAKTYALGLRSSWKTDWGIVDAMITKKWGTKGLAYIRERAYSGDVFTLTSATTLSSEGRLRKPEATSGLRPAS